MNENTMHLLLEINRLKAEILVNDTEIESLKMGFVGNGTADSELAETRAMANRMSLTIKKQQEEIEALKKELSGVKE
jgi:predicted RNase H-like nuclease (RuvC/YqgF family)